MQWKKLVGWVGVLLCLGVPIAYALTASFSDTVWQVPTMKSDAYYVGAADDVTDVLAYPSDQAEYTLWVNGATYYAKSGSTGEITTDTSFSNLLFWVYTQMTSGGTIVVKPGIYAFDTSVTFQTQKKFHLLAYGAVFKPAADNIVLLKINQGVSMLNGGFIIEGATFTNPDSKTVCTAIEVYDSFNAKIINCYFTAYKTAIWLENWAFWTESTVLENLVIYDCTNGVFFGVTGGTNSFMQTNLKNIYIHTPAGAPGTTTYGIYQPSGTTIARSLWENVVIWLGGDHSTGWYVNGDFKDTIINLAFEATTGTPTEMYGIYVDALATYGRTTSTNNTSYRLTYDFQGTKFTEKVRNYDTNYDLVTLDSDATYIDGTQFDTYISGLGGGGTVYTQSSPYDYIVFRVGGTYYANSTTGGTNYSNANFVTLWNSLVGAISDGDSVFLKSGTYVYSTVLDIGGVDNVTIAGEAGAILQCDTAIATAGFRWIGTSQTDHDKSATIRGITFDNNRLTSGPYFKWHDHLTVENCHVFDTVNASLRAGISVISTAGYPNQDVKIINNSLEFAGGSCISVSYTRGLIISGNHVKNPCQYDYPAGGGIQTNIETDYVTITGNVVTGTTKNDGMYLGESTEVTTATKYTHYTVTGNTITLTDLHNSATSGIKAYINEGVISGNTINIAGTADGSVGIHVTGLRNIVSSNAIKCGGTVWAGIYMDDTVTAGRSTISGNIITGTDTYGIENEQDYNYFSDNQILSEATGLHHVAGADQNNLVGGSFEDCTTEISDSGTGNTAHCYINKSGAYVA
jgi:hypothetical protein